MSACRAVIVTLLALALVGCKTLPPTSTTRTPPGGKGFPTTPPEILDTAYLPVDRATKVPTAYGLYTVVLTRASSRNATRVLAEVFTTTGSAKDAAVARENLNLMMIPTKNASQAARAMTQARNEPDATAATVMQKFYDFERAAALLTSVCRADRGPAVVKVCGSSVPDGPLLVTTRQPLDRETTGQQLLILNLSTIPTEAMPEVLAAYRQQITSNKPLEREHLDSWRLVALYHILEAAKLLPSLSKAYAGDN